jgi:hypothetical protein
MLVEKGRGCIGHGPVCGHPSGSEFFLEDEHLHERRVERTARRLRLRRACLVCELIQRTLELSERPSLTPKLR